MSEPIWLIPVGTRVVEADVTDVVKTTVEALTAVSKAVEVLRAAGVTVDVMALLQGQSGAVEGKPAAMDATNPYDERAYGGKLESAAPAPVGFPCECGKVYPSAEALFAHHPSCGQHRGLFDGMDYTEYGIPQTVHGLTIIK